MGSATPINQVGADAHCQTSGFGLWGFRGPVCGNSLEPSRFCLVCSHWECRDLPLAGGNGSVIAEVTSDRAATSPHSLGDNQARSVTSLPITAGKPFNLGVIWGSPLGARTGSWGCQDAPWDKRPGMVGGQLGGDSSVGRRGGLELGVRNGAEALQHRFGVQPARASGPESFSRAWEGEQLL